MPVLLKPRFLGTSNISTTWHACQVASMTSIADSEFSQWKNPWKMQMLVYRLLALFLHYPKSRNLLCLYQILKMPDTTFVTFSLSLSTILLFFHFCPYVLLPNTYPCFSIVLNYKVIKDLPCFSHQRGESILDWW